MVENLVNDISIISRGKRTLVGRIISFVDVYFDQFKAISRRTRKSISLKFSETTNDVEGCLFTILVSTWLTRRGTHSSYVNVYPH